MPAGRKNLCDVTKHMIPRYSTMGTAKKGVMPSEFVDAHHHFLDTSNNDFQSFLASLVPNECYLAKDYEKDVVEPLREAGIRLLGSVHVECMPDDGHRDVEWLESTCSNSTIRGIVASVDLTGENVPDDLERLCKASPRLRGIRWILDCVGPFQEGKTATHVATVRHDGIDYLRGSNGGYDGEVVPAFARGFAALAQHNLSFDLQCAPIQLPAAAKLFARHPNIPVCIDHLGKPRFVLKPPGDNNNDDLTLDDAELEVWRTGMKAMAELPHVYVKLSMMGYAVPGWILTPERTLVLKDLCHEVVQLFGPERCMIALNWWKNGALSDADGTCNVGPDPVEFVQHMSDFFADYSDDDRQRLFVGTAREFYRI